jgi:hypothetical protein
MKVIRLIVFTIILDCLLGLFMVFGAEPLPLPDKFLKALHQVETGGAIGPIKGDNGRALGPFQIHRSYFRDSGVAGSYDQCAGYAFSVKVVTGYLNRYARDAVASRNWEKLARIHNGGPNGYNKSETLAYWNKVRKHL